MRNRSVRAKMKLRVLFIFAFFASAAAVMFLGPSDPASAQRRDKGFSHASASHKKIDCSSCHKVPTSNWVSTRGYPDVADFPGHASCINCHRRDFFSGNRPAICAGCHTNPGPRGAARFPFPVRSRSQEFSIVFPHDVHQDLIARNVKQTETVVAHFVPTNFRSADDPKTPEFNNCAICHKTTEKLPKYGPRVSAGVKPLVEAATGAFLPAAGFFKDSPNSHASCFTCHYQNQKPARTDCAGCHKLTTPYFDSNTISRYSIKFDHLSKNHVNKDCMTCHVRIAQNSDIAKMKDADVPILTCSTSSCHGPVIREEIGKREASLEEKKPTFQCIYCHSPEVGRFPIPPSHQN